jgi:hypothetical protein
MADLVFELDAPYPSHARKASFNLFKRRRVIIAIRISEIPDHAMRAWIQVALPIIAAVDDRFTDSR